MDASARNSAMSILDITHCGFEAAENKMEQARQLYRKAEEAQKAVENLSAALSRHELSKEAKLMQGLIKKLDFVLEKRGEELSIVTDSYLDMKKYLLKYTCQIILEIGSGYYGPLAQDGSTST